MPIKSKEEFEDWLTTQPQETRVLIAARLALRVFPYVFFFNGPESLEHLDDDIVQVLMTARAILTSVASTKLPSPEISAAASASAATALGTIGIDSGSIGDSIDHATLAAATTAMNVGSGSVAANALADMGFEPSVYTAIDNGFDPSVYSGLANASHVDAGLEFDTLIQTSLWDTPSIPDWFQEDWFGANLLESGPEWDFWREWYQGFLDGKPMDWELQRRVALIDDAIWEAGPEAVAEEIERIRAAYDAEKAVSGADAQPSPVSETVNSAIAQRVTMNRDALAVSIAGLLEQLADFKERVRGLNHLDPDFREELLEFIEGLSGQLETLLRDLPEPGETVSDENANRLVVWLREFRPLIQEEAVRYVAPKNVTEAAIPTAIILGCTGVGSMLGMPLAGAAVGGLITGQIKPGKAADALMKPSKPDVDGG